MGLEQNWRCDVCSTTAPQGDAAGWRKALVVPLEEQAPPPFVEGMPVVPPQGVVVNPNAICPKPACLLAWAKEQNAVAKDAGK